MADMARPALITAVAAGLLAGAAGSRARPPAPLTLAASDGGDLTIGNGPNPTIIDSLLRVEQWDAKGWRPMPAALYATATCGDLGAPRPATVMLRSREKLKIVGWTGYTCESQCLRLCGVNFYLGEGRYRFGATVRPRGDLIVSNVFTMPRRPPPHHEAPFSGTDTVQEYIDTYAKRAHAPPK